MLVLTRKIGEDLVINNDIVVRVVQAENGRVRLGIQAPNSVRVLRAELLGHRVATPSRCTPVLVTQ